MTAGVTWSHVLGGWQTQPLALVGLSLELATGGLYAFGVARVRRAGRRWPAGRTVSFLLGLATLAFAMQSGFAGYDDDFLWVHMTQHLALMMLAAPLLALGSPVRLCLSAGTPRLRRAIAGLLHDPSVQMISGRKAAILLPLDYYGSMALVALTPLLRLSEVNAPFHEFVHVYFLSCGLLFWVPLLGQDPAAWHPGRATRVTVIAIGLPVYGAIAAAMSGEGRWLSPAHSAADLEKGGLVVALGGLTLTALGILLVEMLGIRSRATRNRRRQERGRNRGSLAGNRAADATIGVAQAS